ncbi:SDR family NAD(P)-dependent oxidoreductase [Actinomadura nitritigenes]|uniref:SDR family NAD(P)-dependent oxidoreductase n=1 Tax=Actinomadura nitritigenes TaxID=134602 RepID=A0ABS3R1Q0_9ACTN|nr:SDR family NAD(P)-dependent oxidoreductase [Actinomadura nitritigenes]MBO2440186.1 SDR family NAD(P)-dependent oxidoreductase [Actinomadura nitritigenes]
MGRISVVTGANQGLGFALAEGLAQGLTAADVVYLTGRDAARIEAAAGRIASPVAEVRTRVLDVTEDAAVAAFADELRQRHGGVDIVFSNAAARLTPDTPWAELVGPFVDTNNLGTTRMLRSFSPILRPGGRLLVVASDFGTLRSLPASLHGRFDTETMSLDDVDAAMLAWRDAVIAGTAAAEGWPEWINIPSKVGQVAAVRVLARERRERDKADATLVAAVCPGLVDTAASRPWFENMSEAQTPEAAAAALLRLALGPVRPETYGELVQFGEVRPWR